jgi:hypothetical protein
MRFLFVREEGMESAAAAGLTSEKEEDSPANS